MAIVIKPTNEVTITEPLNGKDFSLQELQDIVQGHIEIHPFGKSMFFVVNDEGKPNQLPLNRFATTILKDCLYPNDFIVGNALLCKRTEIL